MSTAYFISLLLARFTRSVVILKSYGPLESLAQIETSYSVQDKSSPIHPISTAIISVISDGI